MRYLFLILVIFLTVGCSNQAERSFRYEMDNEDVILILQSVKLPRVDSSYVHFIKEEYLNDSSLLIHIEQHGFDSEKSKAESELSFMGMKVFVYSEALDYWVPDSYFQKFLIRYRNDKIFIDSLGVFSTIIFPKSYVQESFESIPEKDF